MHWARAPTPKENSKEWKKEMGIASSDQTLILITRCQDTQRQKGFTTFKV